MQINCADGEGVATNLSSKRLVR